MLPNTPAEVAGDADVEGAVAFAREDIHARAFLHHALTGNSPINAVIKMLTSMLRTHLSSFPRSFACPWVPACAGTTDLSVRRIF